jgi:hypothetical protein
MESISVLKRGCGKSGKTPDPVSGSGAGFDTSILSLVSSVGVNFFRYMKSLGISGEPNLIVLSSKHQYSYNESDLKNCRILVNLKKLNMIKHLDMFLNSLVRTLPPDTSFIGYFSDKKTVSSDRFKLKRFLRIFGRLYNFLDSGTSHILNRDEVSELLERSGFKTLGMREMNGLTYFISQNVSRQV